MLNHHEPEDLEEDYIPTFRDHTWGDLLDRIAAGISHELAYSSLLLEEEKLQPFAEQLAGMVKVLVGDAWEIYSTAVHGAGA